MDISGLVSYDMGPRAASSAASSKGMMMPHLDLNMSSYGHAGMDGFVAYQPNGFQYNQMQSANYQQMIPTYSQYPQMPQHQYHASQESHQGLPHVREALNGLVPDVQSPVVKHEDSATFRSLPLQYDSMGTTSPIDSKMSTGTASSTDTNFATDVDTLMRAIQSKSQPVPQRRLPLPSQPTRPAVPQAQSYVNNYSQMQDMTPVEAQHTPIKTSKSKKRYTCTIPGCSKSFFQKTHLEIHTRAHTGVKPFLCKESGCGQCFSQLGNLKTHERRHTGERPYSCDQCGKRFAQRGNVRAHRIVHEQSKPFNCKLEGCQKQFTQLGNLKSHQNKFHAQTLQNLTHRFATIREGDAVSMADKELWEYFATLYKNSNKGIKGRGKDRKITSGSGNGSSSGLHGHHGNDGLMNGESLSGASNDGSSVNGDDIVASHHHHHHPHHAGVATSYGPGAGVGNGREGSMDSGRSENGHSRHGAYDFNTIEEGDVELAFADRKIF